MTGHEAHSSLTHLGLSANMIAIRLMHRLSELAESLERAADPASPFTPKHATLTVGQINGGTAVNILARECVFVFDLRCPAGVDPMAVLGPFLAEAKVIDAEMKARFRETGIEIVSRPSAMARRNASRAGWPATTGRRGSCLMPPRRASSRKRAFRP